MKSSRSCRKENVPPVSAKESKIPVPTTASSRKMANPKTAPKSGGKQPGSVPTRNAGSKRLVPKSSSSRSPACNRAVLGELPKEQKKILQVRRALETGLGIDADKNGRALETRLGLEADGKGTVLETGLGLEADRRGLFPATDQSEILFESDASALESIINETGIQSISAAEPGTSQQTMRHTLSTADTKSARSSRVETRSERMETFKRVCDEYIRRSSIMQPHSKRQCMDTNQRMSTSKTADPPGIKSLSNLRAMAIISENSEPSNPLSADNTSHTTGKDPAPFREPRQSDFLASHTPLRVAVPERKVAASPAIHGPIRVKIEKADSPSCHTPVRLTKPTGAQTPTYPTAARVSKIGVNSPMVGTPARILKVADASPAPHTPQRVKLAAGVTVAGASPAVPPPQRVPCKPETTPSLFHMPQRVPRDSNAHASPVRGPRSSLSASTSKKKNIKRNNWLFKESMGCSPLFDSGRRGSTAGVAMGRVGSGSPRRGSTMGRVGTRSPQGLKAMWKTKKTSDKTPVKKEVLTSLNIGGEGQESRVSPILRQAYTSAKKKKLTWADTLESCQSPIRHKKGKKSLFHSDSGVSDYDDNDVHRKVSRSVHAAAEDWTACSRGGSDVIGVRESGRDDSVSTVATVKLSCDRPFQQDITSSFHNAMQEEPDVETTSKLGTQTTSELRAHAPNRSTSTSPSTVDKHSSRNVSPLSSSATQNTAMQLPLSASLDCVHVPVTDNVLAVEGNLNQSSQGAPAGTDVPIVEMLSHDSVCTTQFMSDSCSTMTQLELGHTGNGGTAVHREELIRQQIELFEQKKQQIHLMQMQLTQQLSQCQDLSGKGQSHQGKDKGHDLNEGQGHLFVNVNNNSVNVRTDGNNMQISKTSADVTNLEFERQYDGAMVQFEPRTQGTLLPGYQQGYQQGLDVNSNITVSNASLTNTLNTVTEALLSKIDETKVDKYQMVPSSLSAGPKSTPSMQTAGCHKYPRDCDEMVTPHILRNKSDIKIEHDRLIDRESEFSDKFANVTLHQQRDLADTGVSAVFTQSAALHGNVTKHEDALDSKIIIPLWTPLAFKAVAKQQTGIDETRYIVAKQQTGSDEMSKSVAKQLMGRREDVRSPCITKNVEIATKLDFETDDSVDIPEMPSFSEHVSTASDGHTKIQSVDIANVNRASPLLKRSAFHAISHSRTTLTPSIGSLSLKGNIDPRVKHADPRVQVRGHGESLSRLALRTANERYREALLDEEVALFACRLTHTTCSNRDGDCYNPMAKI